MDSAGGRKRTALWTIGRGSRGLLRFSHEGLEYVIAGTTTAAGNNKVHIVRADEEENDFKSVGVYATESEVWSIKLVSVREDAVFLIAATRRKRRSAVEIWSLSLLDASSTEPAKGSPRANADDARRSVDVIFSVDLKGDAIKVSRYGLYGHLYLSVTNSAVAVLKVDEGPEPKISTSLLIDSVQAGIDESAIVDGGWITESQFFVAYERDVGIYDAGTGKLSARLQPSEVIVRSSKEKENERTAPFFSKITSACVCCAENVLYIGCQDGSLRAFEVRAPGKLSDGPESERASWVSLDLPKETSGDGGWVARVSWEIIKGHSQWVSVLSPMPNGGVLSGDIDGLVRCWTRDGIPSGTFPQHVDTVTCATISSKSFVTISYDGRIALNQVPVVT